MYVAVYTDQTRQKYDTIDGVAIATYIERTDPMRVAEVRAQLIDVAGGLAPPAAAAAGPGRKTA